MTGVDPARDRAVEAGDAAIPAQFAGLRSGDGGVEHDIASAVIDALCAHPEVLRALADTTPAPDVPPLPSRHALTQLAERLEWDDHAFQDADAREIAAWLRRLLGVSAIPATPEQACPDCGYEGPHSAPLWTRPDTIECGGTCGATWVRVGADPAVAEALDWWERRVRDIQLGASVAPVTDEQAREQAAVAPVMDVHALAGVLAQADHDHRCRCGYTPQAATVQYLVMAGAAIRALLGVSALPEEDRPVDPRRDRWVTWTTASPTGVDDRHRGVFVAEHRGMADVVEDDGSPRCIPLANLTFKEETP